MYPRPIRDGYFGGRLGLVEYDGCGRCLHGGVWEYEEVLSGACLGAERNPELGPAIALEVAGLDVVGRDEGGLRGPCRHRLRLQKGGGYK
jgi:hypothetical protein